MGLITELEPSFCAILGSFAGSVLVIKFVLKLNVVLCGKGVCWGLDVIDSFYHSKYLGGFFISLGEFFKTKKCVTIYECYVRIIADGEWVWPDISTFYCGSLVFFEMPKNRHDSLLNTKNCIRRLHPVK